MSPGTHLLFGMPKLFCRELSRAGGTKGSTTPVTRQEMTNERASAPFGARPMCGKLSDGIAGDLGGYNGGHDYGSCGSDCSGSRSLEWL